MNIYYNLVKGADNLKITIIYGQNHKGSTYHIAHKLATKIGGDITEYFLPKDFSSFCLGCTQCFMVDEAKCPHYEDIKPITKSLDEADLIILASPVYVYHASGAMKAFLDHYGYRWMVHRPEASMFKKQAVCISTAAGAGMKSTNKDMADSLFYWGVPKIYKLGFAVRATNYDGIAQRRKNKIDKKISKLSKKIIKRNGKVKPGFKTKAFFNLMRMLQKKGWNEADVNYWQARGWQGKSRPWKNK